MKTILVTGSNGFVGRNLISYLGKSNSEVLGSTVQVVAWNKALHGDLLTRGNAKRVIEVMRPAALIHLAWSASGTPNYENSPENFRWVAATRELGLAAREHDVEFIGTGTGLESDLSYESSYVRCKREAFNQLSEVLESHRFCWLRPHWIFDPVQSMPRVLREARESQRQGKKFLPRSPGSFHDFIHIDDVVTAISAASKFGLIGDHDIASGNRRSVAHLLAAAGISINTERWDPNWHQEELVTHPQPNTQPLKMTGWDSRATELFFNGRI